MKNCCHHRDATTSIATTHQLPCPPVNRKGKEGCPPRLLGYCFRQNYSPQPFLRPKLRLPRIPRPTYNSSPPAPSSVRKPKSLKDDSDELQIRRNASPAWPLPKDKKNGATPTAQSFSPPSPSSPDQRPPSVGLPPSPCPSVNNSPKAKANRNFTSKTKTQQNPTQPNNLLEHPAKTDKAQQNSNKIVSIKKPSKGINKNPPNFQPTLQNPPKMQPSRAKIREISRDCGKLTQK